MGSECRSLRQQATHFLDIHFENKTDILKNNTEQLIEELMLHQMELEIQNSNLREAQLELEESNNKYTELYELAPVSYFTINAKGLIVEVNAAGADLLGIKKEAIINRVFSRYVSPETQFIFSEYRKRLFRDKSVQTCELKLLKRNGPLLDVKIEGKMVNGVEPIRNKLLMMATDVTHLKQSEKELHQNQFKIAHVDRKNSASELVSVIAQELNQPLGIIGNYLHGSIIRMESGAYEKNHIIQALQQASTQLNRASKIILRMKNHLYKENLNMELTCIHSMIKDTISLINYEAEDLPLSIAYQEYKNMPNIMIDKINIQQVILSLARNSIEAMRDHHTQDPKIIITVNYDSIDYIEISLSDNGPGYSPEHCHQLFDPHFTTKSYGIGLGLAISRSIVESHGGKLISEINCVYGACFKFTLPIKTGS
jgi:PAS domain S-box-containing protein